MCRKIRCDGYCANFFGLHGQLNRPWIEKVICGGHACTLITAESWQTGANHATGKRWMDRLYSITTHMNAYAWPSLSDACRPYSVLRSLLCSMLDRLHCYYILLHGRSPLFLPSLLGSREIILTPTSRRQCPCVLFGHIIRNSPTAYASPAVPSIGPPQLAFLRSLCKTNWWITTTYIHEPII
jgi:hypothetical protein